jgi:antitoxin (DNA-binding transcriptional repressor) of toxin-antitoxin stability system
MSNYNIHEAKSQLSKLIDAAQRGERVVIAKAGKPVAVLGAFPLHRPTRVRGLLSGQIPLGLEFDDDLPPEVLDAFESNV